MCTINLLDIFEYASGFKRPLKKGSLLAKSKTHFFGFGRIKTLDGSLHFVSACLTHKVKAQPHRIHVLKKLNFHGEAELKGSCTCKANSSHCKHVIGFMLKLERLSLSEIPEVSKTEVARQWGKVNEQRLEAEKPSRFSNLCHVRAKKCKYHPFPTALPPALQQTVIDNILQAFPNSIANKAVHASNAASISNTTSDEVTIPYLRLVQSAFKGPKCISLDDEYLLKLYCSQDEQNIFFYHDYVDVSEGKAEEICTMTKFQNNEFWRAERQIRITASSAYSLYTYIQTPKTAQQWEDKLSKAIVNPWRGNRNTEFGKAKEEVTKRLYRQDHVMLSYVGLIVPPDYPWFGFSPDGFILENNELLLIEIKCLKVGRFYTGASFLKRVTFLILRNGEYVMKRKHMYYAQIQLGLAFCNLKRAKLLLYVHKNKTVIEINVPIDVEFVNDLVSTLTRVYFEKYLPYLVENKTKLKKL